MQRSYQRLVQTELVDDLTSCDIRNIKTYAKP